MLDTYENLLVIYGIIGAVCAMVIIFNKMRSNEEGKWGSIGIMILLFPMFVFFAPIMIISEISNRK